MKNRLVKLLLALTTTLGLCSCQNTKVETGTQQVIKEEKFNSSYIGLTNEQLQGYGFSFGDSCNIYYSNGKSIEDVPYYDGYYTRSDFPLICGYQGYPYVQITINNSSDFWDQYELSEDTTVNVTLNQKGKYKDVQEAFSMHYYNDRNLYTSDEEFANFRQVTTSNIKANRLFRGASPFNNTYNRASYVDKLLKENDVKFIVDLSDTEQDMITYQAQDDYDVDKSYAIKQNKVLLGMGSNFRGTQGEDTTPNDNEIVLTTEVLRASAFRTSLATGLNTLIDNSGAYYVHCVEGKDRTGFVCMLLEALCGASYAEMRDDYMVTYTNYFGIQKGEAKYDAVVHLRFDEFMEFLSGKSENLDSLNYVNYAKTYLLDSGMSETQINDVIDKLTK